MSRPTLTLQHAIRWMLLGVLLAAGAAPPAIARGGGGHGGFGRGMHMGHGGFGGGGAQGAAFARDGRKANDKYVKAASEELDKLLDKKLNICRGC